METSRDMSLDAIKRRVRLGQSDQIDAAVLVDELSRRLTVTEWQALQKVAEAEADRVFGVRMVPQLVDRASGQ